MKMTATVLQNTAMTILLALAAPTLAQDAQYYIGYFNADEFPFNVGTCNPVDILGNTGFQKATCIDEHNLKFTRYSESTCTNEIYTLYYNETHQTGLGTLYDFNCDNSSDANAYVSILFGLSSCDTETKVTINAATGVCAYVEYDEVAFEFYCEQNWATWTYYDWSDVGNITHADCGDESLMYNVANATQYCGFIVQTHGLKIFGQVLQCEGIESDYPSMPPTIPPSSAPSMSPTVTQSSSCSVYYCQFNFYFAAILCFHALILVFLF